MSNPVQLKSKTRRKPGYDFVSPFSLEKCVSWLQSHDGRVHTPNYQLKVEVQPIDNDTYTVNMKWSDSQEFIGYLKRWDNNSTYITGRGQMTKSAKCSVLKVLMVGFVFIFCLAVIAFIATNSATCANALVTMCGLPFISGLLSAVIVQVRLRSILYEIINGGLGDLEYQKIEN